MSGTDLKRPKKEHRFFPGVPVALEIFCMLLPALLLAGWYVYATLERSFRDYESAHLSSMMARYVENGTEQIRLEAARAKENGESIDLEELLLRLEGLDSTPVYLQTDKRKEQVGNETDFEKVNMQFGYVLILQENKVTVADASSQEMTELPSGDDLALHAIASMEDGKTADWGIEGALGDAPYFVENEGAHCVLKTVPVNTSVSFRRGDEAYSLPVTGAGMVSSADFGFIRDSCKSRARKIVMVVFGAFTVFSLLICISIYRDLKLLRDIRRVVWHVSKGSDLTENEELRKLLLPDRTRPRSELGDLAESFYLMSGNILEFRDNVESISERYRPFVPDAILALFGKEDKLEIAPGDSVSLYGELLEADAEESSPDDKTAVSGGEKTAVRGSETAAEEDTFLVRNQFLAAAAETVARNNGIVISMGGSFLSAFFPEGQSDAAEAAETTPGSRAGREILALRVGNNMTNPPEIRLEQGQFLLKAEGSEHFRLIRMTPDKLPVQKGEEII